jgi:hypothetical protein
VLEKLAICQSHVQPTTFTIVVVNDALAQEIQVFKEHTNVFEEYMFSTFCFNPMDQTQLYRIMYDLLDQNCKFEMQ